MIESNQENLKELTSASLEFIQVLETDYNLIVETLEQIDGLLKDAFSKIVNTLDLNENSVLDKVKEFEEAQADKNTLMGMLQLFSLITTQFQGQVNSTIQALQVEDMISQLLQKAIDSHKQLDSLAAEFKTISTCAAEGKPLTAEQQQRLHVLTQRLSAHQSPLANKPVAHTKLDEGGDLELF